VPVSIVANRNREPENRHGMLDNWLRPVAKHIREIPDPGETKFGNNIQRFEQSLPDLKHTQVALIGIGEEEADAVRSALYPLSFPFGKLKIADLGNVRKEDHSFIIPVISELLEGKICPVIIGREGKFLQAQFEAHHAKQPAVSLAVVNEKLAFHPQSGEMKGNYLNPILQNKAHLFHFTAIGCQSHFVDEAVFRELEKRHFDCIRLGKARANLPDTEPFIRDADLLGFHLNSLKRIEAPGVADASPSGFFTEEACQISRYAGMSDKLTSIGFYGFEKSKNADALTAGVVAQLVWYFLDGFFNRKNDFPASTDGLTEYIVDPKGYGQPLTFWKSNKTGRWWLQVPVKPRKKHQRHRLIACSYNDYILASKDDLPPRLLQAFKRFD
jgi:formiminoglutamase